METISSLATVARKSVFGESATTTQSGTEPPAGGAPGEGTKDAPYDPGNVPEQVPTVPGTEPPAGGPPGKGTIEAPFDRGNEPEQTQVTGSTTDAACATEPPPSKTTHSSKIDNPNISAPSEVTSTEAYSETANTANKVTSNTPSESDPKPKKTGTVKPTSHSALFGLGKKEEGGGTVHPPQSSGELSGTIDEAGKELGKQADMEKKGATEDDTGGYVGLKKAAMEEEEKRRNGGAEMTSSAPAAAVVEDEERVPSMLGQHLFLHVYILLTTLSSATGSMEKKNSLGREISPCQMPDGTHRKSIAEGMPQGHGFGRKNTASSGEKTGGFRDRLKDKFRSKK